MSDQKGVCSLFHEKVYLKRVSQLISRVKGAVLSERIPMDVEFCYDADKPIPYEEMNSRVWSQIALGEQWGELWGSAWFRFNGTIPEKWNEKKVFALINVNSEAAVWKNGYPWIGLMRKKMGEMSYTKNRVPVGESDQKSRVEACFV